MNLALLAGPTPTNDITAARWEEQRRRRRLLEGAWKCDLRDTLAREYEPQRRRRLGLPDTTKNLFRSAINQLAVLYDSAPIVSHPDAAAAETMRTALDQGGAWELAQTLQEQTMGCREGLFVCTLEPGGVQWRIVPPDLVDGAALITAPDQLVEFVEYRIRTVGDSQVWTRDYWSIRDPENPIYRVQDERGIVDLSEMFGAGAWPDEYRYPDGAPFLPAILYHARRTGKLWDAQRGIELADAALGTAGLLTQWKHVVRDASWPQRYAIDCEIAGGVTDSNGDRYVQTDEASILNFRSTDGVNGSLGQFSPGGDPASLLNAIENYAAGCLADFDVAPADIARTHTDARSGYAIEITRSGQRAAATRAKRPQRRGDLEMIGKVAALLGLPVDGWSIKYPGIPMSMQEKKLLLEEHKERSEMGVTSKPALLAKLDGITEDQARDLLRQYTRDRLEFGE